MDIENNDFVSVILEVYLQSGTKGIGELKKLFIDAEIDMKLYNDAIDKIIKGLLKNSDLSLYAQGGGKISRCRVGKFVCAVAQSGKSSTVSKFRQRCGDARFPRRGICPLGRGGQAAF